MAEPRPQPAPHFYDVWRQSEVSSLRPRDVMLVTDFDGTLAAIAPDPTEARIESASVAALGRLATKLCRIAILSSRPTADLSRLVPVAGVELIGDSGVGDLTPDERERLDRFNVKAAQLLSGTAGVWLETKPGATAVHFRHASVGALEILRALDPLLERGGLSAQRGRRVIEVMPRARPKGVALESLVRRWHPDGVVCMGDDENDRPMFEFLAQSGLRHVTVGVVSEEARADLFQGCDLTVSGASEVSRLLMLLADWASRTSD